MGAPLRLAAALTVLLVAPPAAGGPSPPPVRIESVSVAARNPLRAGDRLPVSLRGTGGGAATFHIFGIAADIGMRELRSAGYQGLATQYAGVYQVRPGDAIRGAAVFATLTVRGVQVVAPAGARLTIDARPPRLLALRPAAGARLTNARPNIAVELIDLESGIDPRAVRLLVNGGDVTGRATVSDTAVTYNPAEPFRPGRVRIEIAAADRAGNRVREGWAFDVAPATGLISSVTLNPATVLVEDDLLTVVASGAPGGRAAFTLTGIPGERPMRESRTKGVYFGTLVVPPRLEVVGGTLRVTIAKDGASGRMAASVPVTILPGAPAPPTVVARGPAGPLDDPAARLDLTGTARPGHRVIGRVDYEAGAASFVGTGALGEFTALAAANGAWRATFTPLAPIGEARLIVTVVAVDPAGRRSPPVRVEVNGS